MAYSTKYGVSRFDEIKIRKCKWGWMFGVLAVALVFLAQAFFPDEMNRLREAAFPFFRDEVQLAVENMAEDIRNGVAAGEAVKVFCEEILSGAAG